MHFPDILKFCNRMGIRPVNDVTAQVTADVTVAMDPDGMGAHMGPPIAPLPLAEDGLQTPLLSEMVTKREFILAVKELGGIFVQGHATTLEISQKNQTQVFGLVEMVNDKVMGCVQTLSTQVVTLNNEVMGHVVTLNNEVVGHVVCYTKQGNYGACSDAEHANEGLCQSGIGGQGS